MDDLRAHLEFFEELGIDGVRLDAAWRRRAATDEPANGAPDAQATAPGDAASPADTQPAQVPPSAALLPDTPPVMTPSDTTPLDTTPPDLRLRVIREDLGDCTRCKLHTLGRRQVVFGVGNPTADLMFVGEAPGADEDQQGEPFVGRAGQLLTKIIEAIGMTREEVYIANVIKCRPPQNRNPEPDEVEQCEPFLFRQIDSIRPKVIVALGKFAAQSLLRTAEPITRLRGREFQYRDAILMPTYHPAYLLRNPSAKRDVWEDMKRVKQLLTGGAA